ncbi:hypothetical protein BASA81_001202 [Batrachochytrium salamandrivorans]|nr:hypothetical protein BASA81_001202 [Batrachochytrium salamandrivorans]
MILLALLLPGLSLASTSTLFQRLGEFEKAAVECNSLRVPDQSELDKLNLCGFSLVANPVRDPEALAGLRSTVLASLPIDTTVRMQDVGTVRLQTVHSPLLLDALLPLPYVEHLPHHVFANLWAGSSDYKSKWFHYPSPFEQRVLRKRGLSFYDIGQPTRYDLIVPLFLTSVQNGTVEMCAGSQYVSGVTVEECALLLDKDKRQICLLVATGECPKWAIARPLAMRRGEAVLLDSRTLRRNLGSDFDPRRIRVDIQATTYVSQWFYPSPPLESCANSNPSPSLWFGNVNVGDVRDSVELYRGNYEYLVPLPPGGNVTLRTIPGIYTLRVQGKVKETWEVASQFTSAVFYAIDK